jgi:hypothetical protein
MENEAYLSKETGAVYWHSEYSDDIEEVPNDIDDGEKYLLIPHRNDLGLGKPLALRFTEDFLSGDLGKVREIFGRRGAYSRFKDLLENRRLLDRWHDFEAAAQKQALLNWCKENGVEIDG